MMMMWADEVEAAEKSGELGLVIVNNSMWNLEVMLSETYSPEKEEETLVLMGKPRHDQVECEEIVIADNRSLFVRVSGNSEEEGKALFHFFRNPGFDRFRYQKVEDPKNIRDMLGIWMEAGSISFKDNRSHVSVRLSVEWGEITRVLAINSRLRKHSNGSTRIHPKEILSRMRCAVNKKPESVLEFSEGERELRIHNRHDNWCGIVAIEMRDNPSMMVMVVQVHHATGNLITTYDSREARALSLQISTRTVSSTKGIHKVHIC